MRVVEWRVADDVEEYARAVTPFLEREPCSRNVLRWIIELARAGAGGWRAEPVFAWLADGEGSVLSAASWAPPFNLLVSEMTDGAADDLVQLMRAAAQRRGQPLAGVTGPEAGAAAVARSWERGTGSKAELRMREVLYELTSARDVPAPAGRRRASEPGDEALLVDWMHRFSIDTGIPRVDDPARYVRHMTATHQIDVWTDGGAVVSMCGHRLPVAGVVRIGPVYTPEELRGRGYARRLVAEVSGEALHQRGVHHCMLYADLANPVSNKIYRQIGYTPKEPHADYAFPAMPAGSPVRLAPGGGDPPR